MPTCGCIPLSVRILASTVPLTDELGAEVVVADRGSRNLRAARAHLHAREAVGGSGVAWGEQQRALGHVAIEVEGVLGVGCQLGEANRQFFFG